MWILGAGLFNIGSPGIEVGEGIVMSVLYISVKYIDINIVGGVMSGCGCMWVYYMLT